jgi:HSP20 family molecular chaperone IbpA
VEAELPGRKREGIQVTHEGGDPEIRVDREAESELREDADHQMEPSYGSAYRRPPLPFEAKAEQIRVPIRDRVLEIRSPQATEAKPRRSSTGVAWAPRPGQSPPTRGSDPLLGACP